MAQLLKASGYETEAVESGEEALEVLSEGAAPRAALIDLDLPGMSGEELLRHITRTRPSVMPVLITAADLERIDAIRQDDSIALMRKPIDVNGLLRMLNQRLAGNPAVN